MFYYCLTFSVIMYYMDTTQEKPAKRTRTMTPERLEKLAIARQKALDKKKMMREVAEAEKEFKKFEF